VVETGRHSIATGPWAAYFASDTAAAAGALRLHSGIQALQTADGLWIRGDALTQELDSILHKLAPTLRCRMLADEQLLPEGKRVPAGSLPRGTWQPICQVIAPQAPKPFAAAVMPGKVALRLVRRTGSADPSAMLTDLSALRAYADTAPAIRLARLSFALRADGAAIVRGTPLPPIAGIALAESQGILIPCGWGWDTPVPAAVVRQVLGLRDDQIALVLESSDAQVIESLQFVQLSRAAARQSAVP
jgi:hypothetical protein